MGHKINIQNNNIDLQSILNMIKVLGLVIPINTPYQSGVLQHNGEVQYPEWKDYDGNQCIIGGTISATDAGTYTATFTPKSGYAWADGSTSTKAINWKIKDNWAVVLKDFNYTENADGTATITGWKQTLNGVYSTELVIPDNPRIIL